MKITEFEVLSDNEKSSKLIEVLANNLEGSCSFIQLILLLYSFIWHRQ